MNLFGVHIYEHCVGTIQYYLCVTLSEVIASVCIHWEVALTTISCKEIRPYKTTENSKL